MPEASPYNQHDLVQLIGQCTIELAYLRGQVTTLQARLAELEKTPPNGVVLPSEVPSPA